MGICEVNNQGIKKDRTYLVLQPGSDVPHFGVMTGIRLTRIQQDQIGSVQSEYSGMVNIFEIQKK